jgi:hypothetical protein
MSKYQWGDVDSAAVLTELLWPPDAPLVLFVGTLRSEDRATSPFLQALFAAQGLMARDQKRGSLRGLGLDCRELAVEMLAHDEASTLAQARLGEMDPAKSVRSPPPT